MKRPKNTLFVIIDQLRADCLFGTLANHADLPNLRVLMKEAVSFRSHYSVCNPCGPARASILTGQYAMNHRAVRNGTPLPFDRPNLATELRKGGHLPLLFGYTDITQDPRHFHPNDPALHTYEEVLRGFQEVVEMRLEESWPWRADLIAKGYDVPPYPDIFRPQGDDIDDPALYEAQDSDTAFLASAMIRDLAARPPGWFAHLTFIRPHPPFVAPAPYNRKHDPKTLPPPHRPLAREEAQASHPFIGPMLETRPFSANAQLGPDLPETDENIGRMRAVYLGLAAEVDHHFGRIVDFLRQAGLYDDTLIVVTADHGEMLGDYHAWGKMTYHDAAYHVPLIIRDPDNPDRFGSVVDHPTESVDISPTLLDLLGLDIPHSMDGRSLVPLLGGDVPDDWRQHTCSELDFGNPVAPTLWQRELGLDCDAANLAIFRDERYTLVHFAGEMPQILFDRQAGGEDRNIAGDPGSDTILLDLSRRLLSHRMTNTDGSFSRTIVTRGGVNTS